MSGAIPPLPQYAFMAWCSVKAQGQLYLTFYFLKGDAVFSYCCNLFGSVQDQFPKGIFYEILEFLV
jgi:hypothetical protein